MPDEQGLLTVMEYAVKWKLNTNSVQRMLQEKRLAGVKVGKSWRIPADAIPAPVGEKAILAGGEAPVSRDKANLAQNEATDPEMDKLDSELVALEKEEEKVDRLTAIAQKKLALKSDIGWDAYLAKLGELQEAEAKVVADREQLAKDRESLVKLDSGLDDVERSLRDSLKVMDGWWDNAGGLVLQIVEAVQAIQYEATYDKKNPQAYQSRVTGFGGETPPEKTLLVGKALQERWYEVFKILVGIAKLPKPDFHIDVHRSDVDLLNAGGSFDDGEPEQGEPEDGGQVKE